MRAYDADPAVAQRYSREMRARLQLEIEPVRSVPEAVKGLDIVVTSGPILKHPAPTIEAGWLAAGSFASLVDFDSYWQGGALREFDKMATDDHAQMHYYRETGYFQETPEPYDQVRKHQPDFERAAVAFERGEHAQVPTTLDPRQVLVQVHSREQ